MYVLGEQVGERSYVQKFPPTPSILAICLEGAAYDGTRRAGDVRCHRSSAVIRILGVGTRLRSVEPARWSRAVGGLRRGPRAFTHASGHVVGGGRSRRQGTTSALPKGRRVEDDRGPGTPQRRRERSRQRHRGVAEGEGQGRRAGGGGRHGGAGGRRAARSVSGDARSGGKRVLSPLVPPGSDTRTTVCHQRWGDVGTGPTEGWTYPVSW